jgi:hypothetical protein
VPHAGSHYIATLHKHSCRFLHAIKNVLYTIKNLLPTTKNVLYTIKNVLPTIKKLLHATKKLLYTTKNVPQAVEKPFPRHKERSPCLL